MKSLDPPALARDESGRLVVRAKVTASDTGGAASAYDPASATGVLFTTREKRPGFLVAKIHVTGLMP